MRPFYFFIIAILLAFSTNAQITFVTNPSGTTFYGSYGCTVTSTGSVTIGGGSCLPFSASNYWAANGAAGSYIYTMSAPVYKVHVESYGLNGGPLGAGEYVQMYINGVAYPMTTADVTSFTECGASAGSTGCYLSAGRFMGPLAATGVGNYDGGDWTITVCTGITSFELYCNGTLNGVAYRIGFDSVRPPACVRAVNNSPCIGDTLKLNMIGDSLGATYIWSGPGGFSSTLKNPFVFPTTFADSGDYTCIRFLGVVNDTSTTHVSIHPKPVINATSNAPLCVTGMSTLKLFASPSSPGETFLWSGPLGFTSTLQNPTLSTFVAVDSGDYYVYATTQFGCKDTAYTHVGTVRQPPTPIIIGPDYCQGDAFVAFTLDSIIAGDTVKWYTSAVGGLGSSIAPTINTLVPGLYHVWASQKAGSCESARGTDSVRVRTTPPAPIVTGPLQYCQFIGPVVPLTVTPTATGTPRWYTVATGGVSTSGQPTLNINVAGTTDYYVSQIDSGCEGPRTHVAIVVHPKPNPPIIVPTPMCQFMMPVPVKANVSGTATDILTWYGPGVTAGSSVGPTIPTNIAPDTTYIYVTETSIYGCVSDSALDKHVIKEKPPVPITKEMQYCQHSPTFLLNQQVDSLGDSHLNWYQNTHPLAPTPKPTSDTVPGTYTWYVNQTVPNNATGCKSDSVPVHVTIIYKPVFGIAASSNWLCQYDSIKLSYCCGARILFAPNYKWVLPAGTVLSNGSSIYDSSITVQFNNALDNNYVTLFASNDSGFCTSDTTISIKVIKQPEMTSFTKGDVCLGDTVLLGLSTIGDNPYDFKWYIDNSPLNSSSAIKMISSSSSSGGPYQISWIEAGVHVVKVTSTSMEGCKSLPTYDSVNVHTAPDATFMATTLSTSKQLCLEDSVLFSATVKNYGYSYEWSPVHAFNNVNVPEIWGKVELKESKITLKVTDPFGCYATTSQTYYPESCCSVIFPNAFTPNAYSQTGTVQNNVFRPIFSGFHRFHTFRIVNRWGITVFEGGNTNVSWDGTYNGSLQDMGTYMYYLKYDCGGKTIEAKGDVMLIR